MKQVVGKYMQAAKNIEANKRNHNSMDESGDGADADADAAIGMEPPGFKASIDDDFISEQGDGTLNPRLINRPDDNTFVSSVSNCISACFLCIIICMFHCSCWLDINMNSVCCVCDTGECNKWNTWWHGSFYGYRWSEAYKE